LATSTGRVFGELFKKTSFDGIVIVESVEHLDESLGKLKKLLDN